MKKIFSNLTGQHYLMGFAAIIIVVGIIYYLYNSSQASSITKKIANIDNQLGSSRLTTDQTVALVTQKIALQQQLLKHS